MNIFFKINTIGDLIRFDAEYDIKKTWWGNIRNHQKFHMINIYMYFEHRVINEYTCSSINHLITCKEVELQNYLIENMDQNLYDLMNLWTSPHISNEYEKMYLTFNYNLWCTNTMIKLNENKIFAYIKKIYSLNEDINEYILILSGNDKLLRKLQIFINDEIEKVNKKIDCLNRVKLYYETMTGEELNSIKN